MLVKLLSAILFLFPLSSGAQLYDNNFLNTHSMIQGDYRYSPVEKHITDATGKKGFYLIVNYDSVALDFKSQQEIEMRRDCPVCVYSGPVFNGERGKRLIVQFVNASDSSITIVDQSLNISIIQEAKDPEGKWKPVEYWKEINCECNSRELILRKNERISFAAYRYSGDFETEIRFKMRILIGSNKAPVNEKAYIIYSDVFTGSVNRNQFTPVNPKEGEKEIDFLDR